MKKQELSQCKECKLKYPTTELAKKCEDWCKKYQSCNLDIIKHSIEDN